MHRVDACVEGGVLRLKLPCPIALAPPAGFDRLDLTIGAAGNDPAGLGWPKVVTGFELSRVVRIEPLIYLVAIGVDLRLGHTSTHNREFSTSFLNSELLDIRLRHSDVRKGFVFREDHKYTEAVPPLRDAEAQPQRELNGNGKAQPFRTALRRSRPVCKQKPQNTTKSKSSALAERNFLFEKTGCLLQCRKISLGSVEISQLLCHTYEVSCRARNERVSLHLAMIRPRFPIFTGINGSPAPDTCRNSVIEFSTIEIIAVIAGYFKSMMRGCGFGLFLRSLCRF